MQLDQLNWVTQAMPLVTFLIRTLKLMSVGGLALVMLLQGPPALTKKNSTFEDEMVLQRQIDQNSAKLQAVQKDVEDLKALHVEAQLAKIDQIVEDDHKLLWGLAFVVILSGFETLLRYVPKKIVNKAMEQEE